MYHCYPELSTCSARRIQVQDSQVQIQQPIQTDAIVTASHGCKSEMEEYGFRLSVQDLKSWTALHDGSASTRFSLNLWHLKCHLCPSADLLCCPISLVKKKKHVCPIALYMPMRMRICIWDMERLEFFLFATMYAISCKITKEKGKIQRIMWQNTRKYYNIILPTFVFYKTTSTYLDYYPHPYWGFG